MKKILLIFMAFMIFAYPVHTAMFPQQADAAVASKVASQAAKKIAKEVIVDEAINTATNFALMEAIEIADKYQAKEGYKVVCPSGGSTCDKPIQVKTSLSDSDKSALRGQTEIELEKAITGGKGLTKWQKFLDWFVPVWITSFALTALTYAIDPEARSLFNEVGYNALVALGLISPVEEFDNAMPIEDIDLERNEDASEYNQSTTTAQSFPGVNYIEYLNPQQKIEPPYPIGQNVGVELVANYTPGVQLTSMYVSVKTGSGTMDLPSPNFTNGYIDMPKTIFGATVPLVSIAINGEVVAYNQSNMNVRETSTYHYFEPQLPEISTHLKKSRSVMTRMPYEVGGFWFYDVLFNTVSGDSVVYQIRMEQPMNNFGTHINTIYGSVRTDTVGSISNVSTMLYKDLKLTKQIQMPLYFELEEMGAITTKSQYEDDDGNIALIPPVAITYEEEATGEQVERKPNATGDGYVFEKPDGTIVPEEQVHVPPTWEPNITPSPTPIPNPGGNPDPYPEGTPQITPSPTPSNPNPEPIPLTPSPTPQPEPNPETPPGTPPPPVETTEPYFPEGETCDVGLKIPKFLPLAHSISETFPFSIPFDLYGGFEALFIEMGSERPEFEFAFDFMGKEQSWTIAIPEYFDTWKPFTDSVLIFIFDVGIIYAIYRFMGGGS